MALLAGFSAGGLTASELTLRPYTLETLDGQEVEASLGRLPVPENRRDPESRSIRVAYVRLPALTEAPGPPIFYLPGGAGSPGVDSARGESWPFFAALRELGDVILLDPRGAGLSRPNLICQDSWSFPFDEPLDLSYMTVVVRQSSERCARRLRQDGADLSAYNAREIAADIDDLRRALGADKISLVATSYGTHLAMAVLRDFGSTVHRAVLAGVVGPDQSLKLPAVVDDHLRQLDRELAAAKPSQEGSAGQAQPPPEADLVSRLRRVFARLEQSPVTLTANDELARRQEQLTVGKLDVQLAVARFLTSRDRLAELPGLVSELEAGDLSALADSLLKGKKGWLGRALPYAVVCASGASAARREEIAAQVPGSLFGSLLDFPFPEICSPWGMTDLGDEFRQPVQSPVPALLISGSLDPRTPVENAEEVLAGLSQAHHLVIDGAGHGSDLFLGSPQIGDIVRAFLQGQPPGTGRIRLASPAAPQPAREGGPPASPAAASEGEP